MTIRLTLLALLAAALAAAPASAAGPVALLSSSTVQDIAVAGSDVIVSRPGPLGSARVDALPSGGGPARPLLRTEPRGEDWNASTAVAASPQRVALAVVFLSPAGELSSRLYLGPPGGPLVQQPRALAGGVPIDVAVDGDRVLVLDANGDNGQVRVLAPGAQPRVVPLPARLTSYFAFAGNRIAYESDGRIVLADLTTGARLLSATADPSFNLDVAADGRIVTDGDDIGVFSIMPSGLRQGVPDGEFLENPHFAGDALAAIEETPAETHRPVVMPAGAIHPHAVGLPSESIDVLDADAAGMAWIANDCVLYAPLDAVAPAEPPPGPCARAEVVVDNASYTLRGRRLRLVADCIAATAAGCDGTVTIRERGIVGRGAFHAAPGQRRRFDMRFTRRSVRLVRHEARGDNASFLTFTMRLTDGGRSDRDGELFIDRVRRR
jgi:hypothetical protein